MSFELPDGDAEQRGGGQGHETGFAQPRTPNGAGERAGVGLGWGLTDRQRTRQAEGSREARASRAIARVGGFGLRRRVPLHEGDGEDSQVILGSKGGAHPEQRAREVGLHRFGTDAEALGDLRHRPSFIEPQGEGDALLRREFSCKTANT